MYNFYNHMPVEKNPAPRSAFEIAAAAHEHEKQLVQVRPYHLKTKKSKAERDKPEEANIFAFLKMPLRLLSMAGQWVVTL